MQDQLLHIPLFVIQLKNPGYNAFKNTVSFKTKSRNNSIKNPYTMQEVEYNNISLTARHCFFIIKLKKCVF